MGHRRWLLYPPALTMGTGDVPGLSNIFNAIYVMGATTSPRPPTRDEFIAWPPRGYVPYQVVFARWSFSYPAADFSQAAVTVTLSGVAQTITKETVANGYGDNTIVWGINVDDIRWAPPHPKPAADTRYTVRISNVMVGGSARTFEYDVIVFDPQAPAATVFRPHETMLPAAGGDGRVQITMSPGGAATSDAAWLTITSSYEWTVQFRATANTTGQRRIGRIRIGDATYTVMQAASDAQCSFTFTPAALTLAPTEGWDDGLKIAVRGRDCGWIARADAPWLYIWQPQGYTSGTLQLWAPTNAGAARTTTVTAGAGLATITQSGAAMVVLESNPPQLPLTADGATSTAPVYGSWASGTTHEIGAPEAHTVGLTRYVFTSWSDGGARVHQITVPATPTTYTASFATHYALVVNAVQGGTVAITPASADGFYASGTTVQLTATPAAGYTFSGWTGGLSGTTATASVVMNMGRTVTPQFTRAAGVMVTSDPVGRTVLVDGVATVTPKVFNWLAGTQHTLSIATTVQAGSTGTRYVHTGWNGGYATSYILTAAGDATYTAQFRTEHELKTQVAPAGAGTVTGGGWHPHGALASLWAAPAAGFRFVSWSGAATGVGNPATINVTAPGTATATFACSTQPATNALSVPQSGTSTRVALGAAVTCAWTASSNQSWAQVYPLSGTGSGTLDITVFPNFSSSERHAVITLGGFGPITIAQGANTATADERFVSLLYFAALGRLPAAEELAPQTQALRSGMPRASMAEAFLGTPEFNMGAKFVAGLYVGLLARDAEYGGWLFQRNALTRAQVTPQSLVSNFLNSREYSNRFGQPTAAEFVRLLYRHIMLREGSADDVAFHERSLLNGMSRVDLATAFLSVEEFKRKSGPRLLAFLLHALLLQRDPTAAEMTQHVDALKAGTPFVQLVTNAIATPEHANILR